MKTKQTRKTSKDQKSRLIKFALDGVIADFNGRAFQVLKALPPGGSKDVRENARRMFISHVRQILVGSFQATLLNSDLTSQRVRDQRAVQLYLLSIASLPSDFQPRWFARAPKRKDEHHDKLHAKG